jgi:hypothetical protein
MRTHPAVLFALFFAIPGVFAAPSRAQAQQTASAPVPAQILAAKTILIGNSGSEGDPNAGRLGQFSGGPDRPYNEFYAAMKASPRFSLVSAPADPDLVFEISFMELPVAGGVVNGGSAPNTADAKFRLVILDTQTYVVLWTFVEYVEGTRLQGNRDKNFEQALGRLGADIPSLASPVASTPVND